MRQAALAFDTSNYTTSCAYFDGREGENVSRPLDVPPGRLGLRQSDALFAHVRRLPEVIRELPAGPAALAVGASAAPRETPGSYMPCFLAGVSHGSVLAHALGVPFYAFSHQQGHVAAAAFSAGRLALLDAPMLVWHLSGGTTELLHVKPSGTGVTGEIVGGTKDISAGQLIDRTGRQLGLAFPSGRELDGLACARDGGDYYEPRLDGLYFSLSGAEHKVKGLAGAPADALAYYAMMSVAVTVARVTEAARGKYGGLPVLYSGGVASSALLRARAGGGYFAEPRYCADNAMGIAILTYRAVRGDG